MSNPATCWTLLRDAADERDGARERFARLYLPVVQGYLGQRWRGFGRQEDIEDASQQVLLECIRPDGALQNAPERAERGFRAYLYGVTANVARRLEESRRDRRVRQAEDSAVVHGLEASDDPASAVFDRGWATALAREAGERHRSSADPGDERSVRQVRLLELRFGEGLPIREIAARWGADPAELHHEYATARKRYLACLREVIRFHHPDSPKGAERELEDVLATLG
ncbi:MAG: sigma-70 family RNA polymerase sigma factor [Planctomycetota bacterium]